MRAGLLPGNTPSRNGFVTLPRSHFCFCLLTFRKADYHGGLLAPKGECLLVGCLTSQQHASVSQGRICSIFTCCHSAVQTFPSHSVTVYWHRARQSLAPAPGRVTTAVPIFMSLVGPGQIQAEAGFEPRIFRSQGGRLNHWANKAVRRKLVNISLLTLVNRQRTSPSLIFSFRRL